MVMLDLVHAPVTRRLGGGQGLRIGIAPGGLHVVAHGTTTADTARTAGTGGTLGPIDGLAIRITGALGGELLLAGGGRGQGGATDPELHHDQDGGDRTGEEQTQRGGRYGYEALHDVGEHEQLVQRVQAHHDHDGCDGQVVVAEVVGPRGYLDNAIQGVHF
jgi:hypothetical protein